MIIQTPRDPWRTIWHIATSDYLIAVLLLSIAAGLTITAWLPQTPAADPVAYAQWLSEAQARFGNTTSTMRTAGLFTITRSLGFRVLLALLAGCLLLRLVENGDRLWRNRKIAQPTEEWLKLTVASLSDVTNDLRRRRYRVLSEPPIFQADRWPWADMFPVLAHSGSLLFLVGLLITQLWGWRVRGLIVQDAERATLPGADNWVALDIAPDKETFNVRHSPGIVTFVEGHGPGVRVRADDGAGHPLSLQQTTDTDPVTQLTVALTGDQYFAIPEAQLVVRLLPQPGHTIEAHGPVLVQVYRSPPGRLVAETVTEGDTELTVDGVTLGLASVPYARLTATFNPGLWPTGIGLVLLTVGLVGSIAWPARRSWLRQEAEWVETTGDPLPIPAGDRDEEA